MAKDVGTLLTEVLEHWSTSGPLKDMLEIIDSVWRTNLDRHEPDLGDDAMSLGTQCWRNVMNLAVKHFAGRTDGIVARGGQTLEVTFAGYVMHISKVSTQARSWDPQSIDWDDSEVRTNGARSNALAYTHHENTLFDEEFGIFQPGGRGDPQNLTHLHLAWQGLSDAQTRAFVGFPSTGPIPWSSVRLVHDGRPGYADLSVPTDNGTPIQPTHDSLTEPTLPMRRRAQSDETGTVDGTA